ncbi:response regulator transcription factor [Pseudonocardia sp. NPDC049635]|uniref:response regulator transcription factor n=1 Tax=Pseudonocardia sp. NPDC049635 TaxID=3155506 RepID=UPI0033C7F6C6
MSTIRVVVADDDPRLRESLHTLVDHEPGMTVVGVAGDGAQALAVVAEQRPDVVLMDVRMPVLDGLDATRRLCSVPDGPRVIVLTMFDVDGYVYEALRAGASGFLLKNAPPGALLHAIRVVDDGNALLAPEVTRRLVERLVPARRSPDPRLAVLTARERETLTLIGRGLSNAEIAAELVLTPATVRTYVSRILSGLGARDRAQLVVIAYETGLVTAGTG